MSSANIVNADLADLLAERRLTGNVAKLVALLATRRGALVTRAMAMRALYGERIAKPNATIVDVYFAYARRALQAHFPEPPIENVRGQGWRATPALIAWVEAYLPQETTVAVAETAP